MEDLYNWRPKDLALYVPPDAVLFVVIILLVISNTFMTMAWYNHLQSPNRTFFMSLAVAMFFVVFEYSFNIHANALGYTKYDLYTLKIIQEAITLCVFIAYAYFTYNESVDMKRLAAIGLVFAATTLV